MPGTGGELASLVSVLQELVKAVYKVQQTITQPTVTFTDPLSVFVAGTPGSGAVARLVLVFAESLPVSLVGSYALAKTASTGNASITINHVTAAGTTAIGSVVFNASATGAFSVASAVTLAPGDVLEFVFPSPADATLANIAITLLATRG